MKILIKLHQGRRCLRISFGGLFTMGMLGLLPVAAQEAATSSKPVEKADASAAPSAGNATETPATTSALTDSSVSTASASSDASASEFTNWLTIGGGGTFVGGDDAQFEHEKGIKSGGFGGVEDFHGQIFVGKNGTFTADGDGMIGSERYSIHLDLTDPTVGYVRVGYTQFRTWYDGNGGYYPQNNLSFSLYDNELYIDRGSAWIEAGLTLPDIPVLVFRYEHDYREGTMDSTSWGQTTLDPGAVQRKIVPTFLGINETRDIFKFDVTHKIDDTNAGLGVFYEIDRSNDGTYIDQNPFQSSNAFITQNNLEKNDLLSAHGFTETAFDKTMTFSSGFSVTSMNTDLSGDRIYGASYNAPLSRTFANNGSGFVGLGGGGNSKDYVGNVNLMWTPIADLTIVPAMRVEYQGEDLTDHFGNTSGVGGGFAVVQETATSNDWYYDMAQSLEIRYAGFRDWSLYANAELSEDWGNDLWNASPVLNQVNLNQDWNRLNQKYTVGANWYPLAQLNVGTQYYHEIHDYNYDNNRPGTQTQYPGYLKKQYFTTDDMNIRVTWQALNNVSLITRYDFQYSTVDTWGIPNGGTQAGGVESANISNHILSESINWTPLACLYFQVGGSYVLNSLDTPVAGSAGINGLVLNSVNDYWTLDASAGYEFDEKTHLQLQYSYYRADNYVNNAPIGQPYGAGDEQHSVTATLTREISKAIQVSLKYGFFRNRDETSGGMNDYDAHLVYVSTQFKF